MKTNNTPLALTAVVVLAVLALTGGCAFSHQTATPATLGTPGTVAAFEAIIDTPSEVTVETVSSARWQVPLSGLVNLESDAAKSAGLTDKAEDIFVDVHVIRHPVHGMFFVDSGVEGAMATDPEHAAVRGLITSFLSMEALKVDHPTKSIIGSEKLSGVFLTHMHIDHVMGLPDVPNDTPIFSGPGETTGHPSIDNAVLAPNIDRCFAGKGPVREWQFDGDGIVDIFGDATVFALAVPGHTSGSTAYVVRTPRGPVLLTGDVSHTIWGWQNNVEPGTFTADHEQNRAALLKLKALVERHPGLEVRLGHQHLAQHD